jgi:hypothetical protein
VRKEFSPFRFAACALCLFSLLGVQAYAQDRDRDQGKDQKTDHPNGIVQDWSRHHLAYPRVGPIQSLIAVQHDPRAILSWQEAEREDWHRARDREGDRDGDRDRDVDIDGEHRHSHGAAIGIHQDWSISLGAGTTAPGMYPAKYTFDFSASPSCSTDFIVYPVNVTGSSSQPNIVGFNNLYSGSIGATGDVTNGSTTVSITAGTLTLTDVGLQITGAGIPANDTIATITGTPVTSLTLAVAATATNTGVALTIDAGMCNRAPVVGDDGISATTIWSYNITAAGGQVATSPSLSLDGTKVAFVETGSATTAHFHVLAPRSGDGVAANLQTVTSPISITSGFAGQAPLAGSGTVTDLALVPSSGTASDTLSSPFVDYAHDVAYIGNDSGTLFRVKDVFCPTTVPVIDPACTGGTPPSPSLDTNWGTGGALPTGCSGELTGPVVDGTGNILVGCSDGKLYGFTPAGVALTGSPLSVGNGTATGGIVDPPLVDVVNGFVYVASGSSGGSSVLVQAGASNFTTPAPVTATLGTGGSFPLHAPAFNNAYFSSAFDGTVLNVQGNTGSGTTSTGNTSNWQIDEWAVSGGMDTLYGVGFNSSHVMTSGAAANFLQITGTIASEFSPLTHILNGTTDEIYAGRLTTQTPNLIEYKLDSYPSLFPNNVFPVNSATANGASASEGNGTTGVVVDNVSGSAQASSIYFGVPSLNTAVKLTQSGLH